MGRNVNILFKAVFRNLVWSDVVYFFYHVSHLLILSPSLQIRKMTSANIPALVPGPDAGGPDPAQDTGKRPQNKLRHCVIGVRGIIIYELYAQTKHIKYSRIML